MVTRPAASGRFMKKLTPSSWMALRLTSAMRTCSITCWLSEPPGSCSRLTTLVLLDIPSAISPARSMTALLDTLPVRMMLSSFIATRMSSPGKSCWNVC